MPKYYRVVSTNSRNYSKDTNHNHNNHHRYDEEDEYSNSSEDILSRIFKKSGNYKGILDKLLQFFLQGNRSSNNNSLTSILSNLGNIGTSNSQESRGNSSGFSLISEIIKYAPQLINLLSSFQRNEPAKESPRESSVNSLDLASLLNSVRSILNNVNTNHE